MLASDLKWHQSSLWLDQSTLSHAALCDVLYFLDKPSPFHIIPSKIFDSLKGFQNHFNHFDFLFLLIAWNFTQPKISFQHQSKCFSPLISPTNCNFKASAFKSASPMFSWNSKYTVVWGFSWEISLVGFLCRERS